MLVAPKTKISFLLFQWKYHFFQTTDRLTHQKHGHIRFQAQAQHKPCQKKKKAQHKHEIPISNNKIPLFSTQKQRLEINRPPAQLPAGIPVWWAAAAPGCPLPGAPRARWRPAERGVSAQHQPLCPHISDPTLASLRFTLRTMAPAADRRRAFLRMADRLSTTARAAATVFIFRRAGGTSFARFGFGQKNLVVYPPYYVYSL